MLTFYCSAPGRVKTVKVMSINLKAALQRTTCEEWREYQDVHLWTLLVGYCCARDGSTELGWFADQIKNLYGWPYSAKLVSDSGNAFKELESFLKGFLYHGPVQQDRIATISQVLEPAYSFDSSEYTPSSPIAFELV